MEVFKSQEALRLYFERAHGFAFFKQVGKAGVIGIGGAYGDGDVYLNNKDGTETKIGDVTLMHVSLGWQFGGQIYSEIIFFETENDLNNFRTGNFEFTADASAVAMTASVGVKASSMGHQASAGMAANKTRIPDHPYVYVKGMKVYTVTQGGLMYEAVIAGQKFTYKALPLYEGN